MKVEVIARICHEANRAYALATGEDPAKVHPSWDDAPPEIRESAIVGVQYALDGAGPEELHQSWMQGKLNAGWRFGEVRDNDRKIHPCIVPYDKLPQEQRRKDALFGNIVDALR